MHEHFPMLAHWNIRVEGTDINGDVVQRARAASYHRIEINRGLSARAIVCYFDHQGENWTVKPEIRKMCNFRVGNLCGAGLPFSPFERFDVIFLRNVMLYLSQETRRVLLANIHRLLEPDGVLFLGSSEQPADPSIWNFILAGGTCHFRPKSRE
jgi:chemotaxis protein methyltransferase CheR